MEGAEEFEDAFGVLGVEVASGFVGHDDIGLVADGAGDGEALLLADGKLVGFGLGLVGHLDGLEGGIDLLMVMILSADALGDGEVLPGGDGGQEIEALEDETDFVASEAGAVGVGELRDVGAVEEE